MFFGKEKTRRTVPASNLGAARSFSRGARPKQKHRFRSWLGMIFFASGILAFLGAIVYALFFARFLSVTTVSIAGNDKISSDQIVKVVRETLDGKYLGYVEKNNLMLVGSDVLEAEIKERFPRIGSVTVRKEFPHGLEVAISERIFSLVISSAGKELVIEESGIAYREVDWEKDVLEESSLPMLLDLGGRKIDTGEAVLDPDFLRYIVGLREKIESDMQLGLEREMQTPHLASGDIRLKTEEGWRILIDTAVPAEKEFQMLKLVLENKIEKEKRSRLEYVDLRTDNKVFYKYQGEENVASPEGGTSEKPDEQSGDSEKKKKDKD